MMGTVTNVFATDRASCYGYCRLGARAKMAPCRGAGRRSERADLLPIVIVAIIADGKTSLPRTRSAYECSQADKP